MAAHFLDGFHLLVQKVVHQEGREMRVCADTTQGRHIQKGLVQVFLQDHGGFHGVPNFTPLVLGKLQHILEEIMATTLVLHL